MQTRKEHILIVDDDKLFGEMLQRYVTTNLGYTAAYCESGEAAQALIQKQSFDLIFLDYKMPGISGIDILRWMKEQQLEIPVLMVTNLDSDENAMEAIRLGAYDYIRKDQLDLLHMPVLIESIVERFHYRKERQTWNFAKKSLDRHMEQMEQLEEAIESFGQLIANSMTMLSLGIDECQQELLPHVPDADRPRIMTALTDLKQEYNFVCTSVKSIVGLTQSLRTDASLAVKTTEEAPGLAD